MKSAEIWDELGNTYFKAGVLDKAAEAYGKAIEQKSSAGWSFGNLASIYVQQGKFADAIELYQESLELLKNPKDQAVIWGRLGNIHHHLNEHGKAIQAYQKADEIMPKSSASKINSLLPQISTLKNEQGDHTIGGGGIHLRTIISTDPVDNSDFGEALFEGVAGLEIFKDDLPGSEKGFEKNANVWNELGLILFKVGSYDDAIDAYLKAIALEPSYAWLYSNLGQVLAAQGKLKEAVLLFEKSIKMLPTDKDKAVSWTRLGDIYRQLDQYDEAMAAYELADALNQTVHAHVNEYRHIDPDLITTHPTQTRALVDIEDLTNSVRLHGIIQPLIVCPNKNEPDKYLLIAGKRRLEAARRAGLRLVPVIVRRANDREVLELSINENVHSSAVDPFELANSYRQMANDFDLSIEEISERVGRSPHSVANAMKVLELSSEVKAAGVNLQIKTLDQPNAEAGEHPSLFEPVKKILAEIAGPDPIEGMTGAEWAELERTSAEATPLNNSSLRLWYTEPENDATTGGQTGDYQDGTSLLSRARQALQCNPRARQFSATQTFRA